MLKIDYELMVHYHVMWDSHGALIVTKGETGNDKIVSNVIKNKYGFNGY